jgi:hypothetical protein
VPNLSAQERRRASRRVGSLAVQVKRGLHYSQDRRVHARDNVTTIGSSTSPLSRLVVQSAPLSSFSKWLEISAGRLLTKLRCLRSTPIERLSSSEKFFECFAIAQRQKLQHAMDRVISSFAEGVIDKDQFTSRMNRTKTSAFKELDRMPQFRATARLGPFLETTSSTS